VSLGPTPTALILPASVRAVILDHLRAAWPREGCGLLSGRDQGDGRLRVEAAHPTANVDASGRPDRFEVDPAARFALMRRLRGGASRLVGHFHSHPGHPPVPSVTDRRAAFEPDLVWLIVGLSGPYDPAPALAAWAVEAGPAPGAAAAGFRPLPVV
jgi:proteasome lid subunit RPN8/RPN11